MLTAEEVRDVVRSVERALSPRPLDAACKRAQAFPGYAVTVATGQAGNLDVEDCEWGFAAGRGGKSVFNTRIESALAGAPMWRDAFQDGRCIVPVAAFFEPHASEQARSPRTGRPMKRPYVFADPEGGPLLMAGVSHDGRCSIVTCQPNSWVSPVHARMPLVLRFQEVSQWLWGSPDELTGLADRSGFALKVQPELELLSGGGGGHGENQLALF